MRLKAKVSLKGAVTIFMGMLFWVSAMGCNWLLMSNLEPGKKPPLLREPTPEMNNDGIAFGVWMQGPTAVYNIQDNSPYVGKTNAENYKAVGITHFIGLWNWPSDYYAGYALEAAAELARTGLKAFAGNGQIPLTNNPALSNTQTGVDWNAAHSQFADIFTGYCLGDEPDMKRNSGIQAEADANTPTAWNERAVSLAEADPDRIIYANFGKPIAKDAWYPSDYGNTGSKESDFNLYIDKLDYLSADFYGITDPYETSGNHGIWTYGRAITNMKKHSGERTVWGFIEASAPWTQGSSANWISQRMQSHYIKPIIWNMIISGATGVVYFCHDFSPDADPDPSVSTNLGKFAFFRENGIAEAARLANASVQAYSAVLLTPDVPGTSAVSDGAVEIRTLSKQFGGRTFIFAMGHGNAEYRDGQAVNAAITVAGGGTRVVSVMSEDRTVTMSNGVISDHFEPYELHIYSY